MFLPAFLWAYTLRQATKTIVIHCADTKASQDIGVAEIRKWHTDPKPDGEGWSDIGYHFVIRRDGTIEAGRHPDAQGAHVKSHNADTIGICWVGGKSASGGAEFNITPQQIRAFQIIMPFLFQMYPTAEVCGHRDFSPDTNGNGVVDKEEWVKTCPNFDVRAQFPKWNIKVPLVERREAQRRRTERRRAG